MQSLNLGSAQSVFFVLFCLSGTNAQIKAWLLGRDIVMDTEKVVWRHCVCTYTPREERELAHVALCAFHTHTAEQTRALKSRLCFERHIIHSYIKMKRVHNFSELVHPLACYFKAVQFYVMCVSERESEFCEARSH